MTLQIADLLAIGVIFLGSSLAVVGSALVCLKSELSAFRTEFHAGIQDPQTEIPVRRTETRPGLQDLQAEIRLLDARVDALTEAILATGLICHLRSPKSEPDAPTVTWVGTRGPTPMAESIMTRDGGGKA